jgi:hypothetical protein
MDLDRSLITLAPVIARLPREFKQAGAPEAQFGLPAQPVHDGFRRHACRREDARECGGIGIVAVAEFLGVNARGHE